MSKIKLNPKFAPLLNKTSRYYICSGGRGSSKSFSVATCLALLTFQKDEVILFSRYTMTSAELSVIPEFKEKLDIMGITHLFEITAKEIINKMTGSKIVFRGLKTGSKLQTANLKSISGLTCWVLDEAEELNDEELFDDIARSVRVKGKVNRIILLYNPPTKQHFTYPKFFLNKGVQPGSNITKGNTTYIHTTYLDNIKNLSKDFVEEAEEMRLKNPDKWNRVYGGAYREKAEGIIFTNWKLGEFKDDESAEYCIDWGFSNDPTSLNKVNIDHKRKKVYIKEVLYQTNIIPSKLGLIVAEEAGKKLVIADNAAPELIAECKSRGSNIIGVKKPKIVERISLTQDYEIIVDPSSKNIVNELNNYCWDKNYKSGDRPIDDFNHSLDALGYYITHRHRNKKVKKYRIY